MKRYLFIIIFFAFSFFSISQVFAQEDGANQVDAVCREVLNNAVTDPPDPAIDGDIIVILTESINNSGNNYPCSKIVECVRKQWQGNENADELESSDLKTKYSQCVLAGKDGLDLLNNYARLVYQWIAGIVGAICILIIIVSGIQISIGGLSQEEVSSAKDRITRSLVGMVVLFLSAFILYTINPIFFT